MAKTTARAMSAGTSGSAPFSMPARVSGVYPATAWNSESTTPGSIVVTRTPCGPTSWRSDSAMAVAANLVPQYAAPPAVATRPATEDVTITWPRLRSSSGGKPDFNVISSPDLGVDQDLPALAVAGHHRPS